MRERQEREERERKEQEEAEKKKQREALRLQREKEQELRSSCFALTNDSKTQEAIQLIELHGIKLSGWETATGEPRKSMLEESLLHVAAKRGNVELVTYLLDKGADPNALCSLGRAPIHAACGAPGLGDPLAVVTLLVDRCQVNVNLKTIDNGESPLHVAIKLGHGPIVQFLLNKGAHINAKDSFGKDIITLARECLHKKYNSVSFFFFRFVPSFFFRINPFEFDVPAHNPHGLVSR